MSTRWPQTGDTAQWAMPASLLPDLTDHIKVTVTARHGPWCQVLGPDRELHWALTAMLVPLGEPVPWPDDWIRPATRWIWHGTDDMQAAGGGPWPVQVTRVHTQRWVQVLLPSGARHTAQAASLKPVSPGHGLSLPYPWDPDEDEHDAGDADCQPVDGDGAHAG